MEAVSKEYKTIQNIQGPLVFVKTEEPVGYKELVKVRLSDGSFKNGEVLDSANGMVVIQIFEGTNQIQRQTVAKCLEREYPDLI
jgi:V/A-type H+-transporting ATPase subunit B